MLLCAFDAILAATVLGVAGWTIATRQTFAAVVGFVTYGLLLTLVWVRLAAPDVALTEAAIGGGVTGVLLLGATARLRGATAAAPAEWPGVSLRLMTGALCAAVAAAVAATVCCCCPILRRRSRPKQRRTLQRPASAIQSPAS
jgi:uncharacterized MnhB-related membrane protein